MQIQGSTVLLTGATGGIGEALAHDLSRRGANLIISGRRIELLQPLADELGARPSAADLTASADVARLAAASADADVLIANAALPGAARLERLSEAEADRVIDVNLRAPVQLARAMVPGMVERGRGHLVFVSSTGGKATAPGNPLYHATKFGLRGLAAALRIDLHGTGVGVSCVFPGFISDAGLFARSGVKLPAGVGTRTPKDVTDAVAAAIERNRAEIDVAPLSLRAGSVFWSLAPDLAAAVSRRLGSEQIAATYEDAFADER